MNLPIAKGDRQLANDFFPEQERTRMNETATFALSTPLRLARVPQFGKLSTTRKPSPTAPIAPVSKRERLPTNVPGNVFVDSSCIDCDTCRWVAPHTFHRKGSKSAVHTQPISPEERLSALQAAAACPTGSIRIERPDRMAAQANKTFPTPALDADGNAVPNVYYNGFASEHTFGASSWLVKTAGGWVMMDCPRFMESLARQIEALTDGEGVKYLVLSHSDDVYGHNVWAERLGATRVIHADECRNRQKTDECEIKLEDGDFPYELADDTVLIHTPGHSKGSICMHHSTSRSLFSGDHIAMSGRLGRITAFGRYNHYSWDVQRDSVDLLKDVDFLHVYPGHGRPFYVKDEEERRLVIANMVESMKVRDYE